jgi:hypothetical protein
MEKTIIKADIQIGDKAFKVIGEMTNPNMSSIEITITQVLHGDKDITEYYTLFEDSEKFQFALKESYYKNLMKIAKQKINEASEMLNDFQRFFPNI